MAIYIVFTLVSSKEWGARINQLVFASRHSLLYIYKKQEEYFGIARIGKRSHAKLAQYGKHLPSINDF